jgi:FKBP12-rapamycin complex-associated protein
VDAISAYLPDLLHNFLNVFQADRAGQGVATGTIRILKSIRVLESKLNDHFYLLVPILLQLAEEVDVDAGIRKAALRTVVCTRHSVVFRNQVSQIVGCIRRILMEHLRSSAIPQCAEEAMNLLCVVVFLLDSQFSVFMPTMSDVLSLTNQSDERYDGMVAKILANRPLSIDDFLRKSGNSDTDQARLLFCTRALGLKHMVSVCVSVCSLFVSMCSYFFNLQHTHTQSKVTGGRGGGSSRSHRASFALESKRYKTESNVLKKAWLASSLATKEDWHEWMRRLSLEFLKQSPFPALRTCVMLAQVCSEVCSV